MNKDLTKGDPAQVLWKFCLPLFGSIIFQQIYNIADSLIAGKFIGEHALAAVGNSYEITLIFIAFAFGCNIGTSVIVSQLFGAKRYGEMKSAVSTSLISSGVLCAILMLLGLLGTDLLLGIINTPTEILADSKLYLDIYIWGLPFVYFYNIATGIFTALGDSRTPFIFLACSSTANVFVDILFVKSFGLGVAGVAWATFICQGVSCLLSLALLAKRLQAIRVSDKIARFSGELLREIAHIAVPSILQQSFISVGNIVIQGLVNGYGPSVIAGYSAAIKLNNLVITAFTTLGNGISSFTAQNLGARQFERIPKGFRAGWKMVWLLCVPIVLAYFLAAEHLIRFFMPEASAAALHTGMLILRIFSPFYFVISVKLMTDGILRGAGQMRQFMIATFSDLVLRVVLAFSLAKLWSSVNAIWWAWPLGWIVASALSIHFYRKRQWECLA